MAMSDKLLTLEMFQEYADGSPEIKMEIVPNYQFGEGLPSLTVRITCEERETTNVKVYQLFISEFDYRKYNWLGMLRLIFNNLDDRMCENDYEFGVPPTERPHSRLFPPLGSVDWRSRLRRQLGR